MPKSKGDTFTFYGKDGSDYPFYARDEAQAIRYALEWARRKGVRLYRKKPL
jgi:hypothetical protein